MSLRERLSGEEGVFVPGLMGAGILLSIAMLLGDGVRKVFPTRGERARAARIRSIALGRANDLRAVGQGVAPAPARVRRVPRRRFPALFLGLFAAVAAGALFALTQSFFDTDMVRLSGREEWGVGLGFAGAALFGAGALVWLLSGVLGTRGPEWVVRLASVPPLGQLPQSDEVHLAAHPHLYAVVPAPLGEPSTEETP